MKSLVRQMAMIIPGPIVEPTRLAALFAAALIAWTPVAQARVTRIVIDQRISPAFPAKEDGFQSFGAAGQYETISGRAFGELDPDDPRNAVIQDIKLAPRNAKGRVEYIASFYLVKPIDMTKASGLMWHDVPNRGSSSTSDAPRRSSLSWSSADSIGRFTPGTGFAAQGAGL